MTKVKRVAFEKMMKKTAAGWLTICLLASSLAYAGAAEDYAAGVKAYEAGNVVDAMSALKLAADQGHAGAQFLLAHILDAAEFNEEAVNYYRLSARQGNSDGQFGLASMYATGEGVEKNPEEARKLALLSAEQGNKNAIVMLAQSYISGGLGLDAQARQGADALLWIRRAAELDYLPALIALANAYKTGQYGLSADPAMAATLDAKVHQVREKKDAEGKPPQPASGGQ